MKATKHSCYVCGDYNIDLLKVKTKKHYVNTSMKWYHKVSFLESLYPLEYLTSQAH